VYHLCVSARDHHERSRLPSTHSGKQQPVGLRPSRVKIRVFRQAAPAKPRFLREYFQNSIGFKAVLPEESVVQAGRFQERCKVRQTPGTLPRFGARPRRRGPIAGQSGRQASRLSCSAGRQDDRLALPRQRCVVCVGHRRRVEPAPTLKSCRRLRSFGRDLPPVPKHGFPECGSRFHPAIGSCAQRRFSVAVTLGQRQAIFRSMFNVRRSRSSSPG